MRRGCGSRSTRSTRSIDRRARKSATCPRLTDWVGQKSVAARSRWRPVGGQPLDGGPVGGADVGEPPRGRSREVERAVDHRGHLAPGRGGRRAVLGRCAPADDVPRASASICGAWWLPGRRGRSPCGRGSWLERPGDHGGELVAADRVVGAERVVAAPGTMSRSAAQRRDGAARRRGAVGVGEAAGVAPRRWVRIGSGRRARQRREQDGACDLRAWRSSTESESPGVRERPRHDGGRERGTRTTHGAAAARRWTSPRAGWASHRTVAVRTRSTGQPGGRAANRSAPGTAASGAAITVRERVARVTAT